MPGWAGARWTSRAGRSTLDAVPEAAWHDEGLAGAKRVALVTAWHLDNHHHLPRHQVDQLVAVGVALAEVRGCVLDAREGEQVTVNARRRTGQPGREAQGTVSCNLDHKALEVHRRDALVRVRRRSGLMTHLNQAREQHHGCLGRMSGVWCHAGTEFASQHHGSTPGQGGHVAAQVRLVVVAGPDGDLGQRGRAVGHMPACPLETDHSGEALG